jgi:hypothetical protein
MGAYCRGCTRPDLPFSSGEGACATKDCMQLFPSCAFLNSPPFSLTVYQRHFCVHTKCFHSVLFASRYHRTSSIVSKPRYDDPIITHSESSSTNESERELQIQALRLSIKIDIIVLQTKFAGNSSRVITTSPHHSSRFRRASRHSHSSILFHSILLGPLLAQLIFGIQSKSFCSTVRIKTSRSVRLRQENGIHLQLTSMLIV